MARNEADREDLIRDAIALRTRIEWQVPGEPEPVLTGLKRDQSLSVYFGQDPVFHFDPNGQLRRAYVSGFLYRTQGQTLARLNRERTESETTLLRADLEESDLARFLEVMRNRLACLETAVRNQTATILRSVIDESLPVDFLTPLRRARIADPPLAPAIPGRR